MLDMAINAMICLGSVLMAYNVMAFVRFARNMQAQNDWSTERHILYLPIILLALFLVGYVVVGIFGNPDLVMAGILFGGSIFVFIMYQLLSRAVDRVIESEKLKTELLAAEQSNEAKVTFLSTMSHEMLTPMNVIIGLDEVALKNPDLTIQTRDQLEKIGLSARHLLSLINNLLDASVKDSASLSSKCEEFSLRASIEQVNAIEQALCDERGLTYQTQVDDNVPDICVGEDMQLRRVLLSVLHNAAKFTDQGGTVTFAVSCTATDNDMSRVRFAVTDTGIGMSEDFLPKVFEAFSQEESGSTARYGGGGLSLSVANRTIEQMGGHIEAHSTKGVGSTFVIEVPLHTQVKDDEQPVAEVLRGVSSLEEKRILIVEDMDENAEIVADLLELEGAITQRAENGQIAVDMVAQSPYRYYDAILMDLRMPVMDGLEATRQIRALDHPDAASIPIIALTANAFQSDVEQSLAAGMNAHLSKPTDVDMLYETLMKLIRPDTAEEGNIPS